MPPALHLTPADAPALPGDQRLHERLLLVSARAAQAVKARYVIVAVSLAVALADLAADLTEAPWYLLLLFAGVVAALNAAADAAARRGRGRPWRFYGLLGVDTLMLAANAAALGTFGYLVLPFGWPCRATSAARSTATPRAGGSGWPTSRSWGWTTGG